LFGNISQEIFVFAINIYSIHLHLLPTELVLVAKPIRTSFVRLI